MDNEINNNKKNNEDSSIVKLQDYLKYLRESHGYSQEQVADELHIIRQTYSHYECGRIVPPVTSLFCLATFYKIPAETLIRIAEADYKRCTGHDPYNPLPDPDQRTDDIRIDLEIRPKDINGYNVFIEANRKRYNKLNREEKCCLYYFNSIKRVQQSNTLTYMKIAKQNNEEPTKDENEEK